MADTNLDYQANTTQRTDSIVIVSENKMKCIFENKSRMTLNVVKVDGGLITGSQSRCDYIVHWQKESNKTIFYIELKGNDVHKAFQQLKDTINLTKQHFADCNDKHCVIVSSRMPQEDTTMKRIRIDLKRMGYSVHTKNKQFSYRVK